MAAIRLGAAPVPPPSAKQRAFWRKCLQRAYGVAVHDGAREALTPDALLESDDPLDMFRWPYPGDLTADPGRVRSTSLFNAIYGDCERGEMPIVPVRWVDDRPVMMTTVNGVAAALGRVARAIEQIGGTALDLARSPGESYVCRTIAGTDRRSMHAWGAALDLDPARTHYWQWEDQRIGGIAPYINTVPANLIAAFEAEGFIWGGRWAHFDTMHFEYRPELLLAAKGALAPRDRRSRDLHRHDGATR